MKLTQVYNKFNDSSNHSIANRNVLDINSRKNGKKPKLIVSTRKYFYLLNPDDIYYLKADSNYCNIVMKDNKPILSSKTLKHYASLLVDFPFIRVHGSYLVNTNKIHLLEKKGD
ncbi:MAG TPA: LytTR family transcriptional regulator, partial [Bacteroidetes bacterium]|nr:LytTR family transcriptional regulator [Bacteroidota bacterium]